jgi:voltage-gated potassium channel Kch
MSVDLAVIWQFWPLLLGALVTITVIKVSVVYGLVRLSGGDHPSAIRASALLPQGGEFGFVLFSTAVAAGVMEQQQATLLVALVTLSMALTPLIVALAPRCIRNQAREVESNFHGAKGSVLLIGFGRFGQVVSQMLLLEGTEVTAIDNDLEMIEAAERFGFKVYFGDGARLDVLRAAGAGRARLICICVERKEVATRILEMAVEAFPLARVLVRAYDRVHSLELLERGAHYQIRETYESAIVYGRAALGELELTTDRIEEVEEDVRARDRARFALQQQGNTQGSLEQFLGRPVPRPEPLVEPKRRAVKVTS